MNKRSEFCPIVGCPGVHHPDASDYDQRWFLVDHANQWIGLERCGPLAAVTLDLRHGNLVIRCPGMLRLDLPMDVIEDDESVCRQAKVAAVLVNAVDEGELAAAWFSNVLNFPCRLFKLHPDQATPVFAGAGSDA